MVEEVQVVFEGRRQSLKDAKTIRPAIPERPRFNGTAEYGRSLPRIPLDHCSDLENKLVWRT